MPICSYAAHKKAGVAILASVKVDTERRITTSGKEEMLSWQRVDRTILDVYKPHKSFKIHEENDRNKRRNRYLGHWDSRPSIGILVIDRNHKQSVGKSTEEVLAPSESYAVGGGDPAPNGRRRIPFSGPSTATHGRSAGVWDPSQQTWRWKS